MKFYKENHINPAASCLPLVAQLPVFISLYLVLKHFSQAHPAGLGPLVAALRPEHHREGRLALVGLRAARRLRGEPDLLDVLHVAATMDKTQRTDHDGAAARLHHGDRALQGRARHLLGDDEPLDGRPGPRHAPARAADGRAVRRRWPRSARRDARDGANGDAANGSTRPSSSDAEAAAAGADPAPPGEAEQGPRPAVSGERTVEATGETVGGGEVAGAARARAARAGARQGRGPLPGRSRRASAGLLGVGYTPARVDGDRGCRPRRSAAASRERPDESEPRPAPPRRCSTQVAAALGVRCRVEVDETSDDARRRPASATSSGS